MTARRFIEIAKYAVIAAAAFVLVNFIFRPEVFLPWVRIATTAVIITASLQIAWELFTTFVLRNPSFSMTPVFTILWFAFLKFTSSFDAFAAQASGQNLSGPGFLFVLSAASVIVLALYFVFSLRRYFLNLPKIRVRPYLIISLSFAGMILLGTILLFLPVSRVSPSEPIDLIDALFTAASAVCVTGLTTFDISSVLSRFGQVVVMILFQTGGLGIMTFTAFFSVLIGDRMSLHGRSAYQNALSAGNLSTLGHYTKSIIMATLLIELAGAILLFVRFSGLLPFQTAVFYSVFHSVSAFCNAGFSLFPDSLMRFQGDGFFLSVMMILIVTGGLGFLVIQNVARFARGADKYLTLHSKLVLLTSLGLILAGAAVLAVLESDNLLKGLTPARKALSVFFSSITPRTAGFNTLDFGLAKDSTLFFLCILMFIGASPGSTGGGIKTTSFIVIVLNIVNILRDRLVVSVFRREVPFDIIRKSLVIFFVGLIWIFLATMIAEIAEKTVPLARMLFEVTSAFGTVGLSTGITPQLSPVTKIVLIITMFLGRVGPLTLVFAIGLNARKVIYRRPEEKILVG